MPICAYFAVGKLALCYLGPKAVNYLSLFKSLQGTKDNRYKQFAKKIEVKAYNSKYALIIKLNGSAFDTISRH